MRIDIFKGDDQVGRHEFGGVDEEEWIRAFFFFHPKRNYFFVRVECVVDADAAIGDFELRSVRWRVREHAEYCCRDNDDNREEDVVKKNARECGRDGDDAERPIPIAPARDVLVFIRTPLQGRSLWGHDGYCIAFFSSFLRVRRVLFVGGTLEGWLSNTKGTLT